MSSERALATIRYIDEIQPIIGATGKSPDKIEMAKIGGWSVVVAKEMGYIKGDKIVYCEIDSLLPEREWSEFMRTYGFKVKTREIKINTLGVHVFSQGLILPLSVLGDGCDPPCGTDVTDMLGVTLAEEEIDVFDEPNCTPLKPKHKSLWGRLKAWAIVHILRRKPVSKKEGRTLEQEVAYSIPITSLERLENVISSVGAFGGACEITEKIDGTSFTAYDVRGVRGFHSKNRKRANPIYQTVYEQMDIAARLERLKVACSYSDVYIQGEIVGKGMIGQRYLPNSTDPKFKLFVYNIVGDGRPIRGEGARDVCANILGLEYVPLVEYTILDKPDIDQWRPICEGKCLLYGLSGIEREGIVVKGLEDRNMSIKFKLVSQSYLANKQ